MRDDQNTSTTADARGGRRPRRRTSPLPSTPRRHTHPTGEPLFVSPTEAGRLLGISRAAVYRLLASGDLSARKAGRRTLVPVESIRAYAASLPPWEPS